MTASAEIHKIFNSEIRKKKAVASGVHHQKGKRGYVGTLYTTADYLSGHALKRYKGVGLVKVSNVYKTIIPSEELRTYTPDKQKQIIETWQKHHTHDEIIKGLGVSKTAYFNLCNGLGVKGISAKDFMKDETKKETAGLKKYEPRPITEEDNIPSYKNFKKMPREKRFKLLEGWIEEHSLENIAKYWDKTVGQMYQVRYQLKKYMQDNDLYNAYIEEKERERPALHKQTIQDVNEPLPEDRKAVAIDTADERVPSLLKVAEQLQAEQVAPKEPEPADQEQADAATVAELKGRIAELEAIVSRNEETQSEQGLMTLNYETQKEGFLQYIELRQFIKVLDKNSDTFQVNVSIRRL